MQVVTLSTALNALVKYRAAKRLAEQDHPGRMVSEEKGATFGKVTGIEEALGRHAATLTLLASAEAQVFDSQIIDDRVENPVDHVAVGALITVESSEYGTETFGIDVTGEGLTNVRPSSPFAQAALKCKREDEFVVHGVRYKIIDVRSGQSKALMENKIAEIVSGILGESSNVLSFRSNIHPLSRAEEKKKRMLAVSDLLDRIQLVRLLTTLYSVDNKYLYELGHLENQLKGIEHFPIDKLELSPGYIRILEKVSS